MSESGTGRDGVRSGAVQSGVSQGGVSQGGVSRRDFLKLSGAGLAGLTAFGAAACGGGGGGGQGGMEGSIDVWIMQPGSDEIESLIQSFADDFMNQNEGSEVSLQFVPWASAHDRFVTAIGGGEVPDLAEMGTTWTPEFASLGSLSPIEEEIDDGYIESLVESGSFEGQSYGLPWYGGARALIYRADILEELGITVPGTWDELIAAGQRIKQEGDGIYPLGVIGDYNHMFLPMVWQYGGEIAEQNGDSWRSAMDSPEAIEAFGVYGDMFEELEFSPAGALNWNSADLRDAFTNGDIAMMIGGGWDLAAIADGAPDMQAASALTPEGPGGNRDAYAGGSHLVVFEESQNKELATAFANFLLADERVSEFSGELGFLPGTESGIEASGDAEDELYAPFVDQLLDHSRTYPPVPEWGGFEGDAIFVSAVQNIMRGETNAEDAMTEVANTMDEEFEA